MQNNMGRQRKQKTSKINRKIFTNVAFMQLYQ